MTRGRSRIAACVAAAVLVPAGGLLASGCGSGSGGGDYKVAAIFDNASFLTPDVDVRIAGAKVGKVDSLHVTKDHKARVTMVIDKKFGPFHTNGDCTIQPQSLISERFINCTPGTTASAVVPKVDGTPTLGLQGTHSPIDIDQLLNTFNLTTRQRLTLLLDSLGVGLAARGEDLSEAIRRAAPALQATHQTLAILANDRAQLQSLIKNSDTVLASLAAGRGRVADFVRQAGVTAATSGAHDKQLAAAVRDLPDLLRTARPSLDHLTQFATIATPFAKDLQRSTPGLNALLKQLKPFADQTTPTLVRLGETSRKTTKALPTIAPQTRRLTRFAVSAQPAGKLLAELFSSFRERGTFEALQGFLYYATYAVARFDKNSHYLPAYLLPGACMLYAKTPVQGCDAHFEASRAQINAAARKKTEKTTDSGDKKSGGDKPADGAKPTTTGETPAPSTSTPTKPLTPLLPGLPTPKLPPILEQVPGAVQKLLDQLGTGNTSGKGGILGLGLGQGADKGKSTPNSQSAQDLLGYLLG